MITKKPLLQRVEEFVDNLIPVEYEISLDEVQDGIYDLELHKSGHSEEYAGLGLSFADQCEISKQFGRTRLCFRNLFSYTSNLAAYAIDQHASSDSSLPQDKRTLLNCINDGHVISFALTEPEGGSSFSKMKSSYIVDNSNGEEEFYLTGSKSLIGSASKASKFLIFAKGEIGTEQKNQLSMFVVEANQVKVDAPLDKMGFDGIDVCNISFMFARGYPIGGFGGGEYIATRTLQRSRVLIAAAAVGMAERALTETIKYATERKTIRHQLVQGMIADSYTELFATSSMLFSVLGRVDSMFINNDALAYEERVSLTTSALKLHAGRMINNVLDNCVQVMGGQGVIRGHIVEEFYRDARAFRIFEGTDEIQKLTITNSLTRAVTRGR